MPGWADPSTLMQTPSTWNFLPGRLALRPDGKLAAIELPELETEVDEDERLRIIKRDPQRSRDRPRERREDGPQVPAKRRAACRGPQAPGQWRAGRPSCQSLWRQPRHDLSCVLARASWMRRPGGYRLALRVAKACILIAGRYCGDLGSLSF